MEIDKFKRVVKSDKSAFRFWKKLCRKNTHIFCTFCGRRNPYRLGSGRYRCRRCRSDFGEFTNRWLSRTRLTPKQWLWALKLFTLEVSTNRIAKELNLSYPAALRATDVIRNCILLSHRDPLLKGSVELDESYFGGRRKGKRGRGAAGKVPVFGILERGGKVSVQVVSNVRATTLIHSTIRKVRRGSIVLYGQIQGL
jgi:transposase